ncbi:hypothetical protein TNCT_660831 [Trichonephila clavata]|uniref:Uncharacterized protein n=1 Tax=Trichonephila clavata TaxID=2740835 RepID=A0A8X6H7B6_TRICU|nr:hypothetical protein TNCT_660831 [Trichonephila clavata]
MSKDQVTFIYNYGQAVTKVTTTTGVRFHIEIYPTLYELFPGKIHYLRLRRANRNNYNHKVSLILSAPGITDKVERTLVFYRGTTLLNLNISFKEVSKLRLNHSESIFCELTTEKLIEVENDLLQS